MVPNLRPEFENIKKKGVYIGTARLLQKLKSHPLGNHLTRVYFGWEMVSVVVQEREKDHVRKDEISENSLCYR